MTAEDRAHRPRREHQPAHDTATATDDQPTARATHRNEGAIS